MKLDATVMRTMSKTDFHILRAVETGMRNHALVPLALITSIANLRHGGCHKFLSSLLRDKLLSHDRSCGYDGYRLTNSGYDILALHHLKTKGVIAALGDRIGTGKESDVYVAVSPAGKQMVLKFHRLGRTSFRDVKKKRDYFMLNKVSKKNQSKNLPNSWLFLSKISALKEYAFMKALHSTNHYRTPTPLAQNRHIVAMSLVRGIPLYQLQTHRVSPTQAESIFRQSIHLTTTLFKHGLIHCDLNEFNLMVDMSGGIQTAAADDDDAATHYVRHSGMTVDQFPGALSAHSPLEAYRRDGTGEIVTEAPPKPLEVLEETGEPKPIVTLIDFPQMVSTRHPNGEELFQRDVDCLKRFFSTKLKCVPEGEDWDEIVPRWKDLVSRYLERSENDAGLDNEEDTQNLAGKIQLRLDEELQASGYSEHDRKRDLELYYFEKSKSNPIPEGSEDSDEEESDEKDKSNDNMNKNESQISTQNKPESNENVEPEFEVQDNPDSESEDEEAKLQRKWALAEEKARERVRRHLEDQKKSMRKRGAFRSRNTNKTYVKGKRIMNDIDF